MYIMPETGGQAGLMVQAGYQISLEGSDGLLLFFVGVELIMGLE